MNSEISLHEYRLAYPGTDRIPTITQRGLIGPILRRHYRKTVRIARRRAAREWFLAAIASPLLWIWRKLTAPSAARSSRSSATVMPRRSMTNRSRSTERDEGTSVAPVTN